MPNTEKHTEKIKCPDCGTIQDATVEHTIPFHTYLHNCEKCNFTIMESDWEVVPNTEKQLTACQMLIEKLTERKNKALAEMKKRGNNDMLTQFEDGMFTAYSHALTEATELLATERQNLIDFGSKMQLVRDIDTDGNVTFAYNPEKQFDNTFKPNK